MATFPPHAFYGGNEPFTESEDDFSEEENYVPPPDYDDSNLSEASDEDHDRGAVDHVDHCFASHAFSCKSMKWWQKRVFSCISKFRLSIASF